ncbi:hypothetical protein D3C85_1266600 [compost metagenome]
MQFGNFYSINGRNIANFHAVGRICSFQCFGIGTFVFIGTNEAVIKHIFSSSRWVLFFEGNPLAVIVNGRIGHLVVLKTGGQVIESNIIKVVGAF